MATMFILIIFLAYITLGIPDSGAGVIWPYMRAELNVPLEAAGLTGIVITVCGAISSMITPFVFKKVNTGKLVSVCSLSTGLALLATSFVTDFYQVVLLGVILGFSAGGVDYSVNTYVSERYKSSVMNWLHASWGLGAMLSPIIITACLNATGSWRIGFRSIATLQLLSAAILFSTIFMWKKCDRPLIIPDSKDFSTNQTSVKIGAMILSVLTFYFYVGTEVSIGTWLNSLLVEYRNFNTTLSGLCVSLYYGSIMAGRVLTGAVSGKIGNRLAIRGGLMFALSGVALFLINTVATSIIGLVMIGIGFSPVYPSMMHETARRFDRGTAAKLMGFQMTAACIGALTISPLVGLIGSRTSLEVLGWYVLSAIIIVLTITITLDKITLTKTKESL